MDELCTIRSIIQTVFKSRDLTELHGTNYLAILKQYSTALFKHYCSTHEVFIDEVKYFEFICIRVIYLSLSLDEMSSHKLYELPHSSINLLVHGTWYYSKMAQYEISVMEHCGWNPLRWCAELLGDAAEPLDSLLYKIAKFDSV